MLAIGDLETFALTPIQKGLLAESMVALDRGLNVEQVAWELDFAPDTARFQAAWQHAVDAFDALRLGFTWQKSSHEPTQTVEPSVVVPFVELDYSSSAPGEQQARLESFLEEDRAAGVDLQKIPLMRVTLIRLTPASAVCVWTIHHSIIDGRSFVIALQRVLSRYQSSKGRTPSSPGGRVYFKDFLRWLGQRDVGAGSEHFTALLSGFSEPTPLPLTRGGLPGAGGRTVRSALRLDSEASQRLRSAAAEAGATPNTVLQLAWALLLSNYSGRSDVVFGTTWTGRTGTIDRAQQIVGPFINTLPVRVRLDAAPSVQELLAALRSQHLALRPFTHTSLADIKAKSELSRAPHLFQTLVVFDRQSLQAELRELDPSWRSQKVRSRSQAGYPLVLAAHFEADALELQLELDANLYDEQQGERLLRDYVRLLRGICESPAAAAFDVTMLEPSLEESLTTREAARELVGPAPFAITRIVEQAHRTPAKTAIKQLAGGEISYAELERRVLAWSSVLRERGIGRGSFVVIWLPRSIAGVVAMLAVHAAGAAFVPLDAQSPLQRVEHVLQDSRAALLLVGAETRGRLADWASLELDVDALDEHAAPTPGGLALAAEAPAYVIYTSGSTGLPKGVVVSQSALAAHVANAIGLFALTAGDRVLQFATPTFDVALEEVLPTLAVGATLILRSDAMASSARAFFEAVVEAGLTVVNLPTAFWHQLVHADHLAWPACLRLVVVGGERASAESHRRFREAGTGHLRWLNAYGPTEATITSTAYDDVEGDHGPGGVPIGRPLAGVSHFVLDERLRPVPPGSVGQLYIGGVGLALGYLFREELTAAAFVPHPWRAGARLYATGDLVRQTARGNYLYVDRPDNQVKVRGFRVELGEIESQLRRHDAVSEAAVVLRDHGAGKALVGFAIADDPALSEADLQEHLAQALPGHMLPVRIVISATLPTTLSGKVDRRALLELPLELAKPGSVPPPSARGAGVSIVPRLLEIWSDVLGAPVPSTTHSFFDLGGHSLLVVRMFSEVEQRFGRTCNAAAFFHNPTIAHLAGLLQTAKPRERTGVVQLAAGRPGTHPLFLAPGLTGRAVDFVHLAAAMSGEASIYGLELRAFRDGERPDESLSDAVKSVVDSMLQLQPRGPFSLAGFSSGGIFAVAMAAELQSRGERCNFVGLIDCVPPASVRIPSPFSSPRRLLRMSRTVAGRVAEILQQPRPVPLLWSRTRIAARRGMARWHDHLNYQPRIQELVGALPNFSAHDVESMQRYLDAAVAHRFAPLKIDLVLFRGPLDPPEGPFEEDLGWKRVTGGAVTVERVKGRHGALLTALGCRELAARIDAYLARR